MLEPWLVAHEQLSVGVDLGGTKTEVALLRRWPGTARYEVLERSRVPTPQAEGYAAIVEATAALVERTIAAAGCSGLELPLGVGMPGSVTRREGVVKNSNTVSLNGRPFRQDLEARLRRRVAFENDANCFALAEARFGAAREHHDGVVFGVILGTGVGGGLVFFGRPWAGPQHLGGEWGHHAVGPWLSWDEAGRASPGREHGLGLSERGPCYCGKTGCLELYLSGPAVERDYERRAGRRWPLARIAAERAADEHAAGAISEMLEAFGRGLGNLISILDPSAVVLGGGVSNLDLLYTEGVASVARYVFNDELTTPILRHTLGDSAGVLGAALLEI